MGQPPCHANAGFNQSADGQELVEAPGVDGVGVACDAHLRYACVSRSLLSVTGLFYRFLLSATGLFYRSLLSVTGLFDRSLLSVRGLFYRSLLSVTGLFYRSLLSCVIRSPLGFTGLFCSALLACSPEHGRHA